jgi:hypothetical protein
MKPNAGSTQADLNRKLDAPIFYDKVMNLDARSQFSPESTLQEVTQPNIHSTVQSKTGSSRRTNKVRVVGVSLVIALLLISGGAWVNRTVTHTSISLASGNSSVASKYNSIDAPSNVGSLPFPKQSTANPTTLAVNGRITVSNGLILTPSTTVPSSSQKGELYYDLNTNQPYYYNGTTFVSLAQPASGDTSGVLSIGGLSGNIALGGGLEVSNGKLTATPQQAATGVTELLGTANQVIASATTGDVTLALPQSIGTVSTPTFAGLNLTTPLGLISGGTGATTAAGARTNLGGAASGDNSDITDTTALNTITPSSTLTIGDSTQPFILQGDGSSQVSAKSGGFTTTLTFAAPTANVDLRFPAFSAGVYDLCTTSGNCAGLGSGIAGSGTTNAIPLFTGTSNIGNSILTQSGTTVTANGTVAATNLTGDGASITNVNAVSLQGNGAAYFTNASNISSGTLADTRLSTNVALLTGSDNFTGTTLQHNGNAVCDNSDNCNYLTGSAASGSYIALQSSSPGTAQTGNLNISGTGIAGSVHAATIYQNGNQVCDTSGNCVGTGGNGAVGGSGTANTLAMFTAAGTVGNSTLSQSGTTVTASGTLIATSLQGNGSSVTNVNAVTLQGNTSSFFTNASNISSGTLADARLNSDVTLQGNAFNGPSELVQVNGSGNLPAINGSLLTSLNASNLASGTVSDARLSSNVVLLNANNNFTGTILQHNGDTICDNSDNCGYLNGAGGGSGGVTALNGLSGTLTVANATGSGTAITINNAGTSQKGLAQFTATDFTASAGTIDTIQGIAITSSPTFAGLTLSNPLTVNNGGTGATTASAARSNLTAAASGVNNDITATTALNTITPSSGTVSISGATLLKSAANSTAAFQVQNSSGANLFTTDTTNGNLVLGNDGTTSALTVRGGVAAGNNVQGSNITLAASNGTGGGGSGDLIFQTAAPSGSSVVMLDATEAANTGFVTNTSLTWAHTTTTNSNRVLLVGVTIQSNSSTVSSVTYNGASLTKLDAGSCPNSEFTPSCEVELWYLIAPATGTHNVVVSVTAAASIQAGAVTYYNVDQTTPMGTVALNNGTASGGVGSTSLTVPTSNTDQVVVDTMGNDNGGSVSIGSGQTPLWDDSFNHSLASSKSASASSTNISWDINSSDWVDIGVPLNPVANTTSDLLADRLHIAADGNVGINTASPQDTLDVAGTARFQPSTNSTAAFQIQSASGTALFTADTTNMTVTVNALVISTTLTVNGHILTAGATPTIAAGSAACSTPTVSVTGNDTAGTITITTGTGCGSSGQLATLTFSSAYTSAPHVVLTAMDSAASLLPMYDGSSVTGFTINTPNTPTDVTTYIYQYLTVQ